MRNKQVKQMIASIVVDYDKFDIDAAQWLPDGLMGRYYHYVCMDYVWFWLEFATED